MIQNIWYVDLFDNSLLVHMSWCLIRLEFTCLLTCNTENRRLSDWNSENNFGIKKEDSWRNHITQFQDLTLQLQQVNQCDLTEGKTHRTKEQTENLGGDLTWPSGFEKFARATYWGWSNWTKYDKQILMQFSHFLKIGWKWIIGLSVKHYENFTREQRRKYLWTSLDKGFLDVISKM